MQRTIPILSACLLVSIGVFGCAGSDDGGGSVSTSNGTTATSNSTTATSNGTTSTSNGTTATSNGTTSTSNGTTSTSNGTTSTSNGTTTDPLAACEMACDTITSTCVEDFRAANCPDAAIDGINPACKAACADETLRGTITTVGALPCAEIVPIALSQFEELAAACVEECEDTCDTQDATQCTDDNDIEVCAIADDGCLAWELDTECGDEQVCDDSGDEAVCADACTDSCDTDGATQCNADGDVETCAEADDGCLAWELDTECGEAQECDDTGDDAVCVDVCVDECQQGPGRCGPETGNIESCRADDNGCMVWMVDAVCDAPLTCTGGGGLMPTCTCEDACEADATQCNADGDVETCTADINNCLVWSVTDDCAEGDSCDDTGDDAVCVGACVDECQQGPGRCGPETGNIESCRADDNGCMVWMVDAVCDAPLTCTGGGGLQPTCTCEDACEVDATQCNADGDVETCAADINNCLIWSVTDDCAEGDTCDETGDDAVCVSPCVNGCEIENDVQCNGDGDVEICAEVESGCLDWELASECGERQTCDAGACGCDDECDAADDTQCNADAVQTCSADADGCLFWFDTDTCEGDESCVEDDAGDAACELPPEATGDDCGDPIVVTEASYNLSGADFSADFTNAISFSDLESCGVGDPDGVEAVFEVTLTEGQAIIVEERGGMDAVIKVQDECDADAGCLIDFDLGDSDNEPAYGESDTGGVFTVIVSAADADLAQLPTDYDIQITVVGPEICDNDEDDEFDGLVDCEDPSCIGDAACADVPARGLYEFFEEDPVDLNGVYMLFTPDENAPSGYTVASDNTTLSGGAFFDTPGTGSDSAELTIDPGMGANDGVNIDFGAPIYNFYGVGYQVIGVNSNGNITFGGGDAASGAGANGFNLFDLPRIAPLFTDLDPSAGGSVFYDFFDDNFGARLVFSWVDVPRAGQQDANSFQIVLYDEGSIEFSFIAVSPGAGQAITGVGDGDPLINGIFPPEVDLFINPDVAPPNWTCAEAWWNDGDCDCGCGVVDIDCADATVESCAFCFAACADGDCAVIVPDDNSQCIVPELNSVTVNDQDVLVANQVAIAEVVTELGGFVVIHEDDNDSIGGVIGNSAFLAAGTHTDVIITLDRNVTDEEKLYAMLHSDDGDEIYEFPAEAGDGPVFDSNGVVIAPLFAVFLTEAELGDLRLVDGDSPNSGRVEIFAADGGAPAWGSVCDDSFGIQDANVACRQLGYIGARGVLTLDDVVNGPAGSPIWLDDLACTGEEMSLLDCPPIPIDGLGSNCTHSEDVGVECIEGDEANFVVASDQTLEFEAFNEVVIDEVFTELGGFVVIHEDNGNGSFGDVIGNSRFLAPGIHMDEVITLDREVLNGETLYAMLHSDDGDEVYEFPAEAGDGPVFDNGGAVIAPPFVVTLPVPGEPNNTPEEAEAIGNLETLERAIDVEDDIDWYVFTATFDGPVTIETAPFDGPGSDADTQIWLCPEDTAGCTWAGGYLTFNDDIDVGGGNYFSRIADFDLTAGTYYIGVQSFLGNPGDYSINVNHKFALPDAVTIAPIGESIQFMGSLDDTDGQWDRPIASCAAGGDPDHYFDVITISNDTDSAQLVNVTAAWSADGYLHAFREPFDLGSCTAGNDDFNGLLGSRLSLLSIASGETVAIVATAFDPTTATGAWTIDVETIAPPANEPNNGPDEATPISVGDMDTAAIEAQGDEDWYVFTLDAAITLDIETFDPVINESVDTEIRVCDDPQNCTRDANLVEDDDDGAGTYSLIPNFSFEPGTYYLVIIAPWNNSTGDYTVSISASAP